MNIPEAPAAGRKPYLEDVRQQYESLPYPQRNPEDEIRRLISPDASSLLVINHHCFRGKRDFRAGFRCLVAGGGNDPVARQDVALW